MWVVGPVVLRRRIVSSVNLQFGDDNTDSACKAPACPSGFGRSGVALVIPPTLAKARHELCLRPTAVAWNDTILLTIPELLPVPAKKDVQM